MRLLNIFGNTVRKRFVATVIGAACCSLFWKDSVVWDEECAWKEPNCDGDPWDNTEIWQNSCTWPT